MNKQAIRIRMGTFYEDDRGGAALLIQKNPALTPNQVKALLMKAAYKNLPRYSTVTDAGVTYTCSTTYLQLEPDIWICRRLFR